MSTNTLDNSNVPMPRVEPSEISAGDTVQFLIQEDDFPPSNGWTMLMSLRAEDDSLDVTSETTPDNIAFGFTITAAQSAKLSPGPWQYGLYFVGTDQNNNAVRFTYRLGRLDVRPDLQTMATPANDPRSWAERMIEKIQDLIEGRIPDDVESYTIAGRTIQSIRSSDLMKWRDYFQRLVDREKMQTAIRKGQTGKKNIGITFLRPSAVYAPFRGFGQSGGGRGATGGGYYTP